LRNLKRERDLAALASIAPKLYPETLGDTMGLLPSVIAPRRRALLAGVLSLISRDDDMATSKSPWYAPEKAIPALLAIIIALISAIYLSMRGDIDELKKLGRDTTKEISETRTSLISSIKDVEKQAAISNTRLDSTNTRLDSILQELKQPQRR
jgi:hypothetical protein